MGEEIKKHRPGKTIVTYEQNNKNTENDNAKEKLLNDYRERYKNILWIDDDCGDYDNNNFDWLTTEDMLIEKEAAYNIKTIKSFSNAVNEIDKCSKKYDLVIFDLNLEEGFSQNDNKELINSTFNNNQIKFDYDNVKKEIAGEYLYLLLLSKGYPKDRMIIYTNNYIEYLHNNNVKLSALFSFRDTHSLFIDKKESIDIDSYFRENNGEYYRIRRLVYQACEYWKKKNPQKIFFNELYGLDDSKQPFFDMLNQIEMMFSVICPNNPEEVYYQAMHIVSAFHEEKANISNAKKGIRPYHQMIRNYRNWSSHKKFVNPKLNARQFAFLFCVALRTYFDEQKHSEGCETKYSFYKEVYSYEKTYFKNINDIDWNGDEVNSKIQKYWKELLKKVDCYGGRKGKESLIVDLELPTLLQRLGEQDFPMPFHYINLSMFESPYKKEKNSRPIIKLAPTNNNVCNGTIEYAGTLHKIECSIFDKGNDIDVFFEKIAFELLPFIE